MIDARLVFHKTEKGKAEIDSRAYNLNHALRYALILVDGKSTLGTIREKGTGLPDFDRAIQILVEEHFIEPAADGAPDAVVRHDPKSEIIAMTKSLLGANAAPVIKKLQDSGEAPDELAETADRCKRLIKLAINEEKADEFVRRAQEIIYSSKMRLMG